MKTVQEILEPRADGSVRLPVPPELRNAGKLRVVAWLEAVDPISAGKEKSVGPGKWALRARGIAKLRSGESREDARWDALRQKFGPAR